MYLKYPIHRRGTFPQCTGCRLAALKCHPDKCQTSNLCKQEFHHSWIIFASNSLDETDCNKLAVTYYRRECILHLQSDQRVRYMPVTHANHCACQNASVHVSQSLDPNSGHDTDFVLVFFDDMAVSRSLKNMLYRHMLEFSCYQCPQILQDQIGIMAVCESPHERRLWSFRNSTKYWYGPPSRLRMITGFSLMTIYHNINLIQINGG